MTFRTKLLLIFVLTVVLSVSVVSFAVLVTTRHAFTELDKQRTTLMVEQFRRVYSRRADEVVRKIEGIAAGDAILQIAIASDHAPSVNEAATLAAAHSLDFLELVAQDGTIISSAQWPAKFGYKEDWVTQPADWSTPFLKREQLPDEVALALIAVHMVTAGDRKLYVIGGQRLDQRFLASLVLPAGARVLVYQNLDTSTEFASLIDRVKRQSSEAEQTIGAENFHAIPLRGRDEALLGVLLVGSSRRELFDLERRIVFTGVGVASAGIVLGMIIAWWATTRVTRPVQCLAAGARDVAEGNWNTHVDAGSGDEISELARAFNRMTRQLIEQRDRLVQAERVAAWRELARRLAHELKNPLFPLQITVENLQCAREQHPEQFDEVFRESTATLLAELDDLKRIIGRFSDFAKMPAPQLEVVNLNEVVSGALKLFEARFQAPGRPPICTKLHTDPKLLPIQADPEQLSRVLQNLVLNAMDAMPQGGTLTVSTEQLDGSVRLEISDTGQGLTPEECERLFTPYYTTKQHGTGLGLAIVQSVISDHGGKISVHGQPGKGATFIIELPLQSMPHGPSANRG